MRHKKKLDLPYSGRNARPVLEVMQHLVGVIVPVRDISCPFGPPVQLDGEATEVLGKGYGAGGSLPGERQCDILCDGDTGG